ncbi:unnamed protein product [Paramecium primaurelia]|uniref:Uncharacterized protein n=1 Tax=Paramecium primaurelia TaxID=5886 RepID=A0A8S1PLN0_PARPR|nr:unnamed protein product [Paramecium primaurelia]
MDQIVYIPEIRYKQINEITIDSQETIQLKYQELEELIKDIQIHDEVEFEHIFTLIRPNCCGCGPYSQKSEFNVQGLGQLEFYIDKYHCCTLWCFQCFWQNCYWCFCCCFYECLIKLIWCILRPFVKCLIAIVKCILCVIQIHRLPNQLYVMENSNIKLEFWQRGLGTIKIKNQIILNFVQTDPNFYDKYCSGLYSSYPQLVITSPFDQNYKLILKPNKNDCPQSIKGSMSLMAFCDMFTTSKYYYVDGLTQGKCEIINFRTALQAIAKISEMQGQCCKFCPLIDYPRFAIQFQNVRLIDKIAIILGLIHISMFNQWGEGNASYLRLKFSKEICENRNRVKSVTIIK